MREDIKERIKMIQNGGVPYEYKSTREGIIPKEWENVRIMKCIHRVDNTVEVSPNTLYTQIGIRSHGKGLFYKEPVLGKELGNKRVFWVEPDCFILNVVFAWEQAIGKTTKEEVGMIGSHRFPMYKVENKKLILDYLIYYFMTQRGKDVMEFASPGGAGRNRTLGQERFLKSKIVLPSLDEQINIVNMLETYDRKLNLVDRMIIQKNSQKKWFVQNYLTGRRRIKNYDDEWKKIKLSEVLKESRMKNERQNLEICSVAVEKGIINQKEHLGRSYAAENTSNYNVVMYGDIVYTKSPTGNYPYGIIKQSYSREPVAVSPLYGVFSPSNYYIGYIIQNFFQDTINICNYLHPIVQKGAKNTINVSNKEFLSKKLKLPIDAEEQCDLVKILLQMNKEIELLQQQLQQTKLEKKAMMQLLLSGIVRVNQKGGE